MTFFQSKIPDSCRDHVRIQEVQATQKKIDFLSFCCVHIFPFPLGIFQCESDLERFKGPSKYGKINMKRMYAFHDQYT